jgi:RNA polymerase sigma factor for flagellar operon FliA
MKRQSKERETEGLWKRYRAQKDRESRNRLVERYLPIVRFVAEKIFDKLPGSVDFEDLTSAGVFGLIHAIDGYDKERGTKFETYCATRVRGAILDELRSCDWVPRHVRSRVNKLQAAYDEMEARLGREPTDEEIAGRLSVSMEEYGEIVRETSGTTLVQLSREFDVPERSSPLRPGEHLEDRRSVSPYVRLQEQDVRRLIHRNLTKQERLIVVLYYFENLTMKEIGAALDLSESRVCQILSRVVLRLKSRLRRMQSELMP